jgi:hypothetical protein
MENKMELEEAKKLLSDCKRLITDMMIACIENDLMEQRESIKIAQELLRELKNY